MNMSAPALLWLVPFSDALASSSNFLSIDTYASRRLSGDQLIAPDQSCLTPDAMRSEEHTSELQSLMRISYAVFCLKKKIRTTTTQSPTQTIQAIHNTVICNTTTNNT